MHSSKVLPPLIAMLLALAGFSFAHPTGVIERGRQACQDMSPRHNNTAPLDPTTAPFALSVSKTEVKGGETVTLKIDGDSADDQFAGFLVQAREFKDGAMEVAPIGEFVVAADDGIAQTLGCGPTSGKDTVMHKNARLNRLNTLELVWTAPTDFTGEIKFRMTIAESYSKFWVGKLSANVQVVQ